MNYDITVREAVSLPDAVYRVAVVSRDDGEVVSEHTVRVEEINLDSLGWKPEDVLELVRTSVQFLLEREAPQAILKEFNLRTITKYFPDYPEVVGR